MIAGHRGQPGASAPEPAMVAPPIRYGIVYEKMASFAQEKQYVIRLVIMRYVG